MESLKHDKIQAHVPFKKINNKHKKTNKNK